MAAIKYPEGFEAFAREKYQKYTCRQMVPIIKSEFGIDTTAAKLKCYMSNHRITCGHAKEKHFEPRVYTPEIVAFIYDNCKGTGPVEMCRMINERFGTSYTTAQLKAYYGNNHLNSGLTGRFEKGHVPYTKGKTWAEYMSTEGMARSIRTTFKKGHIPSGTAPVGTIRLRPSMNMYFQKIEEPNVWRPKHLVEWEEYNGPVPDDSVICFGDGNTANWHIDNLIKVKKEAHAYRNRNGIKYADRETNELTMKVAELAISVSKRKKR